MDRGSIAYSEALVSVGFAAFNRLGGPYGWTNVSCLTIVLVAYYYADT